MRRNHNTTTTNNNNNDNDNNNDNNGNHNNDNKYDNNNNNNSTASLPRPGAAGDISMRKNIMAYSIVLDKISCMYIYIYTHIVKYKISYDIVLDS